MRSGARSHRHSPRIQFLYRQNISYNVWCSFFLTPFFSPFFFLSRHLNGWRHSIGQAVTCCPVYTVSRYGTTSALYIHGHICDHLTYCGTTFTLLFALFFVPSISSLSNLFYLFIFLHGKEVYAGSYLATYWYIRGWMYKRCVRLLPHINRYLQRKNVRTSKSDRPCTYFPVGETMRWTWNIRWEM